VKKMAKESMWRGLVAVIFTALITALVGSLFSCTIYKKLNSLNNDFAGAIAETIKNTLNSSGTCFHSRSEKIQSIILKLKGLEQDAILEFPVQGDNNYRIIGFQGEDRKYYGWNASTVKNLLEESLEYNTYFPENEKIVLIVRNQMTGDRLILDTLSMNNLLDVMITTFS